MGLRILIVDDSPVMRRFIVRSLALSGLEVADCSEAGDGSSALQVLESRPADLILTDINMPGMDGEEFLRRLEQDPALRSVPVLVVSTDATPVRIERMLQLGARGYITKPFSPEELGRELSRVLETAHA